MKTSLSTTTSISANNRNWYLVYTKPRMEDVAKDNLERQGYRTYLPKVEFNKRVKGHYRTIIEPLFPRYLFLSMDTENDNWMPIRSTMGVSHIIRFGAMPIQVPTQLVTNIEKTVDENGIRHIDQRQFATGDVVEIIDGPFSGYSAIFDSTIGKERVALLLDVVGKQTKMAVSRDNVQFAY